MPYKCPIKCSEARKARYRRNKAREQAKMREYYAQNRSKIIDKAKEYRENNSNKIKECKKRIYEKNKETILSKCREYKRKNPHIARLSNSKRRALKKSQRCECCSDLCLKNFELTRPEGDFHLDHIKPLSKGGLHCIKNFQWLSAKENLQKGAKYETE